MGKAKVLKLKQTSQGYKEYYMVYTIETQDNILTRFVVNVDLKHSTNQKLIYDLCVEKYKTINKVKEGLEIGMVI